MCWICVGAEIEDFIRVCISKKASTGLAQPGQGWAGRVGFAGWAEPGLGGETGWGARVGGRRVDRRAGRDVCLTGRGRLVGGRAARGLLTKLMSKLLGSRPAEPVDSVALHDEIAQSSQHGAPASDH